METCKIYTSINQSETEGCSQWVFDNTQQYWGTTLNMKVMFFTLTKSPIVLPPSLYFNNN